MKGKIAIIDQGVEKTHPRLNGCTIDQVTIRKRKNGSFEINREPHDDNTGHGTAIAGIITGINPDVHIISIKIISEDHRIKADLISKALEFCIKEDNIWIANLSLGIPADTAPKDLYQICKIASEKGIAITASAYHFESTSCFPAVLPFVFGVGTGLVKKKTDYGFYKDEPINVFAKGSVQRVAWKNSAFRIASGTSYATAHFSGILSLFYKQRLSSFEAVCELVASASVKNVLNINHLKNGKKFVVQDTAEKDILKLKENYFSFDGRAASVGRIGLFPVSEKELRSVLENIEDCRFKISLCFDYPKSLVRFKAKVKSKDEESFEILRRQPNKHELESFDTLVIGYVFDQEFEANLLFSMELIHKCIDASKNFIIWDEAVYRYIKETIPQRNKKYSGQLFFNKIRDQLFVNVQGIPGLSKNRTPMICVIGTSSKQGKFTVQLKLQRILEGCGYKVGFMGTEPQSFLFGSEMEFPIGHKSTVDLIDSNWSIFLDKAIRFIQDVSEPHIMITGIQGGVLPRTQLNGTGYILSSLNFLTAIKPDRVICCINPMDNMDLIRNTVQTVKIFTGAKNIFYSMTPWETRFIKNREGKSLGYTERLKRRDYQERMALMAEKLQQPVMDITDRNNDAFILDIIQREFSDKTNKITQ